MDCIMFFFSPFDLCKRVSVMFSWPDILQLISLFLAFMGNVLGSIRS